MSSDPSSESDGTTLDSEAELSTDPSSETEEDLSSFIEDGTEEPDSSEEYVGPEEAPTVGQLALPRAPTPEAPAPAPATPAAPASEDGSETVSEGLDGTYWGRPTGKRKRDAPLPYTVEFDIAGEVAAIEETEAMQREIGRRIRRAAETAWRRDPAEVLAWLFQ